MIHILKSAKGNDYKWANCRYISECGSCIPAPSLTSFLSSKFKCAKCGSCCEMGGDMNITADDIKRISDYLECDPNDRTRIPVVRSPSDPDQFMLTITRPCFFLDLHTLECNIYDVRPEACRQYPWDLLAVRGCNLIDVFMCPSALKQLEDHIRSSRCPSDTFPEE